jgi:hypothetical protein
MIRLACGPLVTPWPKPPTPRTAQTGGAFKSSYDRTFADLARELDLINARAARAEFDMTPQMFRRLDSRPYATGLGITSHRVLVAFERGALSLVFACDRYQHWLANLRAISLTLAALRAVDRYGATGGEQYVGFKRLGGGGGNGATPPDSEPVPMTPEEAAATLVQYDPTAITLGAAGRAALARSIAQHAHIFTAVIGIVLKAVHPDHGGTTDAFQAVRRAQRVLRVHHRAEVGV